jgi:RNA methyltransferase, TrmH family
MAGLAAGLRPEAVFVAADATDTIAGLSESQHPIGDAPVYTIDARVAARLTTLETPATIMAVFPIPVAPALDTLLARRPAGSRATPPDSALVVCTDRLADPGNMGTLVRAAAAFAAAALVASPGSVDLFSPKVVRAGTGAVFELPLYQDVTLAQAVDELGAVTVYGLVAHGGAPLDSLEPHGPTLLVVGAERAGLSAAALSCVTDLVTIPLAGAGSPGVESLNAGVAGAIALYELSRRAAGPPFPGGGRGPRVAEPDEPASGGQAPRKE